MKCQKCDGAIVYPEGLEGEKICSNCGLVIDEIPTVRNYTQWTPKWYSNYDEEDSETLREWLTVLRSVSCQLNIPNYPFREEAARTIRKQNRSLFQSQKLSKNKRTAIAALMHIILKEYNKVRPLKEISKELSLDNRQLMKQAWLLNKKLGYEKETLKTQRKTAVDYLHEYAGKTTGDKELILKAENILMAVKRSGGNPIGLAAGAFYHVCKTNKAKISKEEIGKTFKISERTVYTNEARIRGLLQQTRVKLLAAPQEQILIVLKHF